MVIILSVLSETAFVVKQIRGCHSLELAPDLWSGASLLF